MDGLRDLLARNDAVRDRQRKLIADARAAADKLAADIDDGVEEHRETLALYDAMKRRPVVVTESMRKAVDTLLESLCEEEHAAVVQSLDITDVEFHITKGGHKLTLTESCFLRDVIDAIRWDDEWDSESITRETIEKEYADVSTDAGSDGVVQIAIKLHVVVIHDDSRKKPKTA